MSDIITKNRGDTFTVKFYPKDITPADLNYRFQGEDTLYFGIMEPHQPFEQAIVRKKCTADDIAYDSDTGIVTITFKSRDTVFLRPGLYYYMVKFHKYHLLENEEEIDEITTIRNKTKFILFD